MDKERFESFLAEMMPLIDKMIEIAGKYNPKNDLISVACSGEGYFSLANHTSCYYATRADRTYPVTIYCRVEVEDATGRHLEKV